VYTRRGKGIGNRLIGATCMPVALITTSPFSPAHDAASVWRFSISFAFNSGIFEGKECSDMAAIKGRRYKKLKVLIKKTTKAKQDFDRGPLPRKERRKVDILLMVQ
jgi:hypothetical protein